MLTVTTLDRNQRAVLGREWMLHGHLMDRVGMALLLERTDRLTMQQVAIEQWQAASPIYTRRMQEALRFKGTGVSSILKALQLDVGAPHEFMDFRFRLLNEDHGEFWLAHCGALMDVEPMGEAYVHGMCHAIEDPTFDATAGATNPLAQVRPLHRPPRVPRDRTPHCHWRVDVVADAEPVQPSALEDQLATSHLARLPITHPEAGESGSADYAGPFDPDFQLEQLSASAQLVVLDELALQSHLLLRAYLTSAAEHLAADALPRLVAGWCGLTSQRLRDAFGLPETAEGVASLLALHPMLAPVSYTGVRLAEDAIAFEDCPAAHEQGDRTWWGHPDLAGMLSRVVQAAFPTARVDAEFRVTVGAPTADPAPELAIARISTGASFRFRQGLALPR